MKNMFSQPKKILFTVLSLVAIIGYGVFVYAAPPTGGYAPGTTLDPDCAPGDTDCVVSIGGLNPNSILYTNANGNTTTDSSFTRNATNYDTYIGRTYQNTLPGDLTLTLDSLMLEYSTNATPGAYIPGENLVFENVPTNATYTGVYQGFGFSIPEDNISDNTTFNGTGLDDLSIDTYNDYINNGPAPTTFTFTITDKNVSMYAVADNYNGSFQIGETVIGSNSGATGTVVSTEPGLVLDTISGTFQYGDLITGNSSGATVNNEINGDLVDVYSYNNGDVSGVGITGRGKNFYNHSLHIYFSNITGHEIGDQWTVEITTETFYIHIHKISDVSDSISIGPVSITGQTSNTASEGSIYATTPLGNPGDNIIFQNFSGPQPTISGTGVITAVNGNNYGIEMGQGSTYNIGDLALVGNQNNNDFFLALVSAANTDPITIDMSSGFSINSNIAGIGLRGSVFQQTDGTVTGVMGAIDSSSVGGQAVTLGSNISSTATVASSLISQTLDEIIQRVETAPGESSALTLTGTQFRLSTTYTDNPNPALESGFMSTFNQSTTLVPAWFVGSNVQKLPGDLGSNGYVLTTDGSGNLSWAASSGGSSPISINGSTIYSSGFGNTGSYSNNNIFLGDSAGYNANNLGNSNFLGYYAGYSATDAYHSNFFGAGAGQNASSAENSNFFGQNAGNDATNASNSNFFGQNAGNDATNASNSNFFGYLAGFNATYANNSSFIGNNAGYGATNAEYSNFIGNRSGYNATYAVDSNFIGPSSGEGATNALRSNFFGSEAGISAVNASNSNFFGANAGANATDATYSNFIGVSAGESAAFASNSNFFGQSAGYNATYAVESNFFGPSSGDGATNALRSNFFGSEAGISAVNASNSNFFGANAGANATDANNSSFIGNNAGYGATNAANSNFFGQSAGYLATGASGSNFFGYSAGIAASGAYDSNFFGQYAGSGATDAARSNFIGQQAGMDASGAYDSNFFGNNTGSGATNANTSNFFGTGAGNLAVNANNSNFLGSGAGLEAVNADNSNFVGVSAGWLATDADYSTFIGASAGDHATNASRSFFVGYQTGKNATNAFYSVFIGDNAGQGATNASNSIFIGNQAGLADSVDNTSSGSSIVIGANAGTGGYSNSIALGSYAINTASNQFMIGSATRPIDTTRINGSASTQCTITTGTGIACTSDERVKTNITDLTTDTLDKLLNVKTVSYNWLQNPTSKTQIGFLAQDLEQYFPELVETDSVGMKSVYYAQMTPILVEAIREMNLKIVSINDMDTPNTWRDALTAWFANVNNGITKLFANEIETKTLCVSDDTGDKTCITKAQLDQLLNGSVNGSIAPAPAPSPDPTPVPDPETDTPTTGDNVDPETSGDEPVPSDTPNTGEDQGDTPPADSAPADDPAPTE